jgi:5-formyltetrahydrofolate cyclo-ligase
MQMNSSSQKLEVRTWAKAQRAALSDVSSLVCGHLVGWLGTGLDDQYKGRPYRGMGVDHDIGFQVGEHTVRPYGIETQIIGGDKNVHAETSPQIRPADQPVVLSYKAFGAEISLETLPAQLPHCQFLTTRVAAQHTLTLHDFSSATHQNHFGILEPPPDAPAFAPELVDMALIPGLAFTRDGGRLGYGGGFYDRLLPQLRPDCLLVGITHSSLLLPALPLEPHDIKMQFLALETEILACTQAQALKQVTTNSQ